MNERQGNRWRWVAKDPWRQPRILGAITWGYLAWSILPVVIAVGFSFNAGRSRSAWQGFSFRWWAGNRVAQESLLYSPDLRSAVLQTFRLAIVTTLIAVPLGTLFAIGLDRWHGRGPGVANFAMLLSLNRPEIIIGTSRWASSFVPTLPHEEASAEPRHAGAAAGADHVPGVVPGDRREGAIAHDREGVRRSRDGSGRAAHAVCAPRLAAVALPRDLRECCPRVRRHR